MPKNSMSALDDDQATVAVRNLFERQSDLIGESLAHDQQPARALAEQLLAAPPGEHVGVEQLPQARPRVADQFDQRGVRLSSADRQRFVGYQQRAQPGSIVARDAGAKFERRTAIGP